MENSPTQAQTLEKKVEEKVEHVEYKSIPDSQEIVKELENSSAILEKKAEEVKKQGWLKSKIEALFKTKFNQKMAEEALKNPFKKSEYEKLLKEDATRAEKYKTALGKFKYVSYDEKTKDYVDTTVYSVASGEGTSGK